MTATENQNLTLLTEGQENAHILVNEHLNRFDLSAGPVLIQEFGINAEPFPVDGYAYIIGGSPTGTAPWTLNANKLAIYRSGWVFVDVYEGLRVYEVNQAFEAVYSNSVWHMVDGQGGTMPSSVSAFSSGSARYFHTGDNVLYYYDFDRSAWLSVEEYPYHFSHAGNMGASPDQLEQYGVQALTLEGSFIPWNATATAIAGNSSTSQTTKQVTLLGNDSSIGTSDSFGSGRSFYQDDLDIDIASSSRLRAQIAWTGTAPSDVLITLWVRRRR